MANLTQVDFYFFVLCATQKTIWVRKPNAFQIEEVTHCNRTQFGGAISLFESIDTEERSHLYR